MYLHTVEIPARSPAWYVFMHYSNLHHQHHSTDKGKKATMDTIFLSTHQS